MKILHAGNMANLAYYIVKTLRGAGLDAELLMQKYPPVTADPRALDQELEGEYPDWIRFWDNKSKSWKSEILRYMKDKQYDLIHAYVELPIFAYLSRRPFIAHSQGSDLTELAFAKSVKGVLLRRAYRKAKVLIYFLPHQYTLIEKIKLQNTIFLPPPWDYEKFKPQNIERKELDGKFVIFHPTNLDFRWKGNDKFLRAFIRLSKECDNIFLLLIYRGVDMESVRKLLADSGVLNKVRLIPGPLGQSDLQYYYNLAEVVVDQFVYGSVGSIAWETLCCEKPLVASIYVDLYAKLYGEAPPIVNAKDELSIYKALRDLADSSALRQELGKKGREWVIKYHNKESFVKRCIRLYEGVMRNEDFESMRESIRKIN